MHLVSARVGPFRSINTAQTVTIDPEVTVLVGMNEAGKTVFLKALNKSRDAVKTDSFDPTDDYPRKGLNQYLKVHDESPQEVVRLTYVLDPVDIEQVKTKFGVSLPDGFEFSLTYKYDNESYVSFDFDESSAVSALIKGASLSSDAAAAAKPAKSLRELSAALAGVDRTDADEAFLEAVNARVKPAPSAWRNVVALEAWRYLSPRVPRFLYFSDYDLLPGKMNLKELQNRVAQAQAEPKREKELISSRHRAVLALLRMADVDLSEFGGHTRYELLKAKVEGVSINLTDQVLEFWKQNEDLEVEVDIRSDPADEAPYNDGPNLYLRIKNKRHRGVTTPFDQRSRGFIWFFSFLVWFDSVQNQLSLAGETSSLVLLLDEPALALHALAQADFLKYIDKLAVDHQVIYTTHSPFMVHSDRLYQVRVVEDRVPDGTTISQNLGGYDDRTIFPLQAALGWNLAQHLFIGKRNLTVEGPSEILYLNAVSAAAPNGVELSEKITLVPVGGLGNVSTFVSLLGANGLHFAVLTDFAGVSDPRIDELVQRKLLAKKSVFRVSQFRDPSDPDASSKASDIEDLLPIDAYLECFNRAYAKQLGATPVTISELPPGDRIVDRIERALESRGLKLRPSGGFNHYLVALEYSKSPPPLDAPCAARFAALFTAVNAALK